MKSNGTLKSVLNIGVTAIPVILLAYFMATMDSIEPILPNEKYIYQVKSYMQEVKTKFSLIREELVAIENEKLGELYAILSKLEDAGTPDFYLETPQITLVWHEKQFNQFVSSICTIQPLPLKTIQEQQWTSAKRGSEVDNIYRPHGLTVDKETNDIYIADCYNSRIQVFSSEGVHKQSITHSDILNPHRILCTAKHLLVTDPINRQVSKLDKASLELILSEELEFTPGGLDVRHSVTYICNFLSLSLYLYDEELYRDSILNLKFSSSDQNGGTHLLDVRLSEDFLYAFLENSFYRIHTFDLKGNLLSCLIPSSLVSRAFYFCVDKQCNILVSSWEDNQILVYSSKGKPTCRIGNDKKGESNSLVHPRGIDILSTGELVICDNKDSTCLHCYVYM